MGQKLQRSAGKQAQSGRGTSTKLGPERNEHKARPERAEHLNHCKENMPRRDRNPARPNGPQDPKMMSKHCKEQSSGGQKQDPQDPIKSANMGRGTQKEEKEGIPPQEGPETALRKHAVENSWQNTQQHKGTMSSPDIRAFNWAGGKNKPPEKEQTWKTQAQKHVRKAP